MKFSLLPTLAIIAIMALACAIFPEYSEAILALGMLGAVAQGPITDRVRPYELVRWEPNQLYTRTAQTIKNTSGISIAAGAIQAGLPLKKVATQWTAANSGDEASVVGLFLGDDSQNIPEALANNAITAAKYPILFRGPALINQSMIQAADLAGVAYTAATIITSLQALNPPIDMLTEPAAAAIGTQTT